MKKVILFLLMIVSFLFSREPQEIIDTVCSACHGSMMEKSCFSVSEKPNTLSSSYIKASLFAYRDGKKSDYGMGSTMTTQTKTLSDDEIIALSLHIKELAKKK